MRTPWSFLFSTTITLLVVLLSIYASGYMRIGSSLIRPTTSIRLESLKRLVPSSYLFARPTSHSQQSPTSSKTFSSITLSKSTTQTTMPFPPPGSKPKSTSASPGTRKAASELSSSEQEQYNELAVMMTRYHDHFKHVWEFVYTNAEKIKNPAELRRLLNEATGLYRSLDAHHRIEEAYFFPLLGVKLPQFKAGARQSGEHLKSHRDIHDGLETYLLLIKKYTSDPSTYNPYELRTNMDSWRKVLFTHLDDEVKDLGWESMYEAGFTLEEIRAFPG